MSKTKVISPVVETPQEEWKTCMMYLRSIKTQSFEIFKGQKAKLAQSEIDQMHEEIKVVCPKVSSWIIPTPKGTKWCNCK